MAPVETQRTRRNKLPNLIDDYKCRKLSFEKRKSTLKKKAAQLSMLCDVNVCMVCFGSDRTVDTWPENKWDVHDLIFKYKDMSEKAREKEKQKCNLMGFLGDKKRKLDEKLKNKTVNKKKRKNSGESMKNNMGSAVSTWDERLNFYSGEELLGLRGSLDSKLQELREKTRVLQMKKEKVAGIMNPKVCSEPNNLNYDLRRFNGDYFFNQQVDVANWPSEHHHNMNNNILGWSDSSNFGRPANLVFIDENYNSNHMGMVNFDNNFAFNRYFSLGFAHATMGLKTHEERIGLIGESSNRNNYFQSYDPHFMLSHTSPTSQEVLSISMEPSSPSSYESAS